MVSAVALYVPPYCLLGKGAGLIGMMSSQIIDGFNSSHNERNMRYPSKDIPVDHIAD
jgi:hypothetical protein